MGKARIARNTVFGAAVLGGIVYALSRTKRGKSAQKELKAFVTDLLERRESLGEVTKASYEKAVDAATRIYGDSRKFTAREMKEIKGLAKDLKAHWKAAPKRRK